jgi:CheY-like chemotaxis protein
VHERLLVVDDDPGVLYVLGFRLRAAGYDVVTAANGAAGLEAVATEHPAAIVLDLRMPKMDGFTVLSKLCESEVTRSIPVIVLSANVVERARHRALDLGARYFLEKPYDARRLIEAIRSVLASTRPVNVG